MDSLIKERINKEAFVYESKLARITRHLAEIDPALTPYAKTLVKRSDCKDLSDPETFSRKAESLEPTDLVAVHLTDTFPADGIIHPLVYYDPNILRYSIHLTINSVAEDVNFDGTHWSWKERKYAILVPFEKIKARVVEYNPGDTIVIDDLELPTGTVVLIDKNNPDFLKSPGKGQIVKVDYSQKGEKLNGFHRSVYEEMIKMGYFPQLSHSDYGWYGSQWGQYRHIHADLCKRNGLVMGTGHRHHWSSSLEHLSMYLERIAEEKDGEKFRGAVVEAKEQFLEGEDWYAPYIPAKYKQALVGLLHKHGQIFPEVELPK